ncbi:MAG: hypothetical protein R3E32_23935 [Chitinophagales bacterium]
METTLKTPFSNVQLELLKLFSHNIPEDDLLEIKRYLIQYRKTKNYVVGGQDLGRKKWTQKDEQRILDTHQRTPYKAQNEFLSNSKKQSE